MLIFILRKRPPLLLSLLGFELCIYIFIIQFCIAGPGRLFLWQDVVSQSDYCYLCFDSFFSIVDFFESYAALNWEP